MIVPMVMMRKDKAPPLTFPRFTFCWFWQRPNVWHIRDESSRELALCEAPVTCDIAVEVNLQHMAGQCAVCAAICCGRVVSFCEPREVPAIPTEIQRPALPKAA